MPAVVIGTSFLQVVEPSVVTRYLSRPCEYLTSDYILYQDIQVFFCRLDRLSVCKIACVFTVIIGVFAPGCGSCSRANISKTGSVPILENLFSENLDVCSLPKDVPFDVDSLPVV